MGTCSRYSTAEEDYFPKTKKVKVEEEESVKCSPSWPACNPNVQADSQQQGESEFSLAFQNLINAYDNSILDGLTLRHNNKLSHDPKLSSCDDLDSIWGHANSFQNPQPIESFSFSPQSSDAVEDLVFENVRDQPFVLNTSDIFANSFDLGSLPNLFDIWAGASF